MIIHNIKQGSDEWLQFRMAHWPASDSPAAMGASPYKTRNELIKERATGMRNGNDDAKSPILLDGHRFEALARHIAEAIIGEELYPVVGSDGKFSASFDGLTLLGNIVFEHKTLNSSIRACATAEELPLHYRAQMEHQLMVSGADKCLFMASKWDDEGNLEEEPVYFWYTPDLALRSRIVDCWEQLDKDVAAYRHVAESPVAIGRTPDALPALFIQVSGAVTASNLPEFMAIAESVLDGIKTDLKTDEDFADADQVAKWCDGVENKLEAAKQHAISQTASIDELFRTIDSIKEGFRQKRLLLEKISKQRKASIKEEKIAAARKAFELHVAALENDIGAVKLRIPSPDFTAAIKGLKTLSSVQNAIDTALAMAKVDAHSYARGVKYRLEWLRETASQYPNIAPDLEHIISNQTEVFKLLINSRIAQYEQAESAKAAPKQEPLIEPAPAKQKKGKALLSLQQLNQRLGFIVTAEFLRSLGVEPLSNNGHYYEQDFCKVCRAIALHLNNIA